MGRFMVVIVTAVYVLAGFGAEAATILKVAHTLATSEPLHQSAVRFKELVESRTNNAIEVQIYPNQVYGPDEEELTALNLGTVDVAFAVAGAYYTKQLEFQLFSLVYIFRDEHQAEKVFRGPIVQDLSAKLLASKGIRVIAPFFYFGKRQLTANKPIKAPDDLKGLRIRVPNVRIHQEGVTSMGCQAVPLNFAEVYLALKTGLMDGQENPLPQILANKFFEVQKYLIMTSHITTNFMMGMNDASFKRLTPDQQRVVLQAASEAEEYNNTLMRKAESDDLVALKSAGMTVITPDIGVFVKATEPVRQKYAKDFPDLIRRIQETQ